MTGNKTHEHRQRQIQEGEDSQNWGPGGAPDDGTTKSAARIGDDRQTGNPQSTPGTQESRDHNKHNNPGQTGHKPQKHSPAEEKH